MSTSVDRFAKRQAIRVRLTSGPNLVVMPSAAEASRLLEAPVDWNFIDGMCLAPSMTAIPAPVSSDVIDSRLSGLTDAFHRERLDRLFADAKRATLTAIVVPFGLGKLLSAYDKTGGNVDTIHNAREGVYATDEAQEAYDKIGEYDPDAYHRDDKRYRDTNAKATKARESGNLKDSYTDGMLGLRESQSLDHTIAAETIHNDPGRVLADVAGPQLANDPTNLNPTTKTTNSAMQQKTATQYIAWLEEKKFVRDAKLAELRERVANGEELGKKDAADLNKLTEQEKVANNPEPLLEADRKAREVYEKELWDAYYGSPEFSRDCVHTSLKAGARGAFQAAIGAVLVELFAGMWDEVRDWYENGAEEKTVGKELKRRLRRVGVRVARQWKEVLVATTGGFLSGFLSNLLTVLINAFITTAKRTGRMIREGAMSLFTACKMLLIRPETMTLTEGFHEASKVLVGGAVTVSGVALEEAISLKLHAIPLIAPFAGLATAVIVGAATGVASTMAVYMVDKADAFGVNRVKLMGHLNESLDASLAEQEARSAELVAQIQAQLT